MFYQKIKSINNSREYGSELGWVPSRNKSGCDSEILEHDKYTLKYPDLSFDIEFVWHDYGGISELDGDYIDLIYPHNIPLWSGMKNSKMNNIPGCDTCYGSLYNHIRYYNRNLSVHFDYKNGVNDNDQEKEFKILLDALKCIESSIDEYYKKHDESPNKKNDQQPNP